MQLRGRLYFFPAVLPLIEIIPWLLGAIGTAAGVAGFWAKAGWRVKTLTVASACFLVAIVLVWFAMPDQEVRQQGTRLTVVDKLPVPQIAVVPAQAPVAVPQKFSELWFRTVKKQILASPVVVDDLLIFGSFEGSIDALSRKDGTEVWSLPQRAPVFAIDRDANGVVYAGEGLHDTQSATFTALNAADGKPIWQREFLGHIEETPLIDSASNRIWTGAGPGGLWNMDIRDGNILWHAAIGHVDSTPLLVDNSIFVLAQPDEAVKESALFTLDAKSGVTQAKLKLPGQPWGSPFIDRTRQMIITTTGMGQIGVKKDTDRGWIHAVSYPSGELIWQKELAGMAIQPDIYLADAGIVILTLKNGGLAAIRITDGETVWQQDLGSQVQSNAILLEGAGEPLIAVTTFAGTLTIRRALTGEELARRELRASSTSSPVSAGDTLYVTTAHSVTAFGGIASLRGAP